MKKLILGIIVFAIMVAISAFCWWMGGFDPAHRVPDMGIAAFFNCVLCLMISVFAAFAEDIGKIK